MSTTRLLDHFSALDDPRQSWKVTYPLPEVLLIVLCATMAGAEDFVQIELWANRKLDFLRRFLPFEKGIPSHDTLNDVINALPADNFQACFTAWVDELRDAAADIVAIDGKTSRRSHEGAKGRNPLHLVSLRLGFAPAPGARPAGLRREIQRDHRHPRPAGAPGTERSSCHHRRHGLPDQDRRGNPR